MARERSHTQLGRALRAAREAGGLSLRAVADKTGISNAYVSQLESGIVRRPSPAILEKLAALYGIGFREMMKLAGHPIPGKSRSPEGSGFLAEFGELSEEEKASLAEHLEFLRFRKSRGHRAK
jgi:transcriptional regulator with XRE-family HTH domain